MSFNIGIRECNEFFREARNNVICCGYTRKQFKANPPRHLAYVDNYITKYNANKHVLDKCYDIYFGSVTNFRPINAIELYRRYNSKNVLDMCAGWGGRCFAAMECDINYLGFDTNVELKEPYEQLIAKYRKTSNIEIRFEDSSKAKYDDYKYDTVLTSPPYWTLELYPHMPIAESKSKWINDIFNPMMLRAWNGLDNGGHFCINVPKAMYKYLIDILDEADEIIPYKKISRNNTNYNEFIYVWIKK